ncbi:23335_t:CDS:2, partial [Entrophospora sp. SA101]
MFLQLTPVTNIDVKEALMDIIKASIDNNARFKELENDDREYDESYRRNKERFLEHEERLWKYVKRTDPKRQKFQSKCIQISKEILDENPICEGSTGSISDVLRPGSDMVIAGYCMYGSSANMVITLGNGVNGYTLDN